MAAAQPRRRTTRKAPPPLLVYADPVTEYANQVLKGQINAGPHVRAACERHLRDLKEATRRGWVWEIEAAQRAFRFIENVCFLASGEFEGQPFKLQLWQQFIVGSLFGWKKKDSYRRFRVAFVEIGKGNGKSPLAAAIGLYMMTADLSPKTGAKEARAECYAAAGKKEQAMVLFRAAVAMVKQSPRLRKEIKITGPEGREWNLAYLPTASFFKPISADKKQSGPLPHYAACDEIHEHKDGTVLNMLRAGTKGRKQALIFEITNAGIDRKSVWGRHHDKSVKVAHGKIRDDQWFSYVCALDEKYIKDDAWIDKPECWIQANPNLGVSITKEYIKNEIAAARGMPADMAEVARLNMCIQTDAVAPWIEWELWKSAEVEELDFDYLKTLPCYLGLDLSAKKDLTALAAVWKAPDGKLFAAVWFWTPKDTLAKRAEKDSAPYLDWEKQGHIHAVPGKIIDKEYVARFAQQLLADHDVRALAYDQAQVDDFIRACDVIGLDAWIYEGEKGDAGDGLMMVRHGQGYAGWNSDHTLWMPRSVEALEEAITKDQLRVLRNPCLTWASASAVLQPDPAGNKKWEKRKSTGRIDGMVALCQAVGAATNLPDVEADDINDAIMRRGGFL